RPVTLDPMGFTYVRLLTLSEGNSAGNPLAPRAPDLHVLEIEAPGRKLPYPTLLGRTYRRELAMWGRARRVRSDLRLARYRHRDLPVVDPHRQMRHQGTFDVPYHLLWRELGSRQHVYLLDRATLALDDLCGDNPRKRKDELLSTLNGEYAAGDVVQIQSFMRGFDAAE